MDDDGDKIPFVVAPNHEEQLVSGQAMPQSRDASAIFASPEVETSAPFIPPGLSSFVAQAKATLKDTQLSLKAQLQSPPSKQGNDISMDMDDNAENHTMTEDETDQRLKRHVLGKFNNPGANVLSMTTPPKAASAKTLFVEADAESKNGKSPPRSSGSMRSFWAQAMNPMPSDEPTASPVLASIPAEASETLPIATEDPLQVSAEDAKSPEPPNTPPSPRASEGSPAFWSQPMKPEPAEELHVSAEEASSPEPPITPPSPRASEGSPAFWSQPMKPEAMSHTAEEITSEIASAPSLPEVLQGLPSSVDQQLELQKKLGPSSASLSTQNATETPDSGGASEVSLVSREDRGFSEVLVTPTPAWGISDKLDVSARDRRSPSPSGLAHASSTVSTPPLSNLSYMEGDVPSSWKTDIAQSEMYVAADDASPTKSSGTVMPSSVSKQQATLSPAPLNTPKLEFAPQEYPSLTEEATGLHRSGEDIESRICDGASPPVGPVGSLSSVSTFSKGIQEESPSSVTDVGTSPLDVSSSPSDASGKLSSDTTTHQQSEQSASVQSKSEASQVKQKDSTSSSSQKEGLVQSVWTRFTSSYVAPSPIESKGESTGEIVRVQTSPVTSILESEDSDLKTQETKKNSVPVDLTDETAVDDLAFLPNREPVQTNDINQAPPMKQVSSRQKVAKSSIARPRVTSASTRTTASTRSTSTAGSKARMARSSVIASHRPAEGKFSSTRDDGVAKARERVKQRQMSLEAQQSAKSAAHAPLRKSTMSVEEGQARARERIREHKLRMKAKQVELENPTGRRVSQSTSRSAAADRFPVYTRDTASVHRATVPKSPHLATKDLRGQKTYSSTGRQKASYCDENPITRALGSPTHGDSKGPVLRSERSRLTRPTVPNAPRLSTSAKYGEKPPPTVRMSWTKPQQQRTTPRSTRSATTAAPFHFHETRSTPIVYDASLQPEPSLAGSVDFMRKGLRAETPASTVKRQSKLTMPKPFHFHESKHPQAVPQEGQKADPSMAESMDLFMRKGLRDETQVSRSASGEPRLTIPVAPKFTTVTKRVLPKSAAEREEEMMKRFNNQPFRAQPILTTGTRRRAARQPPRAPPRTLTTPVPFRLRVDTRGSSAKPPQGTPDMEACDLEECKKQFHARPLPKQEYRPRPRLESVDRARSLTTPKPFHFATDKRSSGSAIAEPTHSLPQRFHARPLPRSTYVSPAVSSRKTKKQSASTAASPTVVAHIGPPKLSTSTRTARREASRQESMKNVELKTKEKERMARIKQREKHHEEMVKASIRSPLVQRPTQPFVLQSEARHEAYQHQMAEQRQQEEQENRRRMSFHAQPIVKTSPPVRIHSERPCTEPRPFHLTSVARHEMAQNSIRQHLEEEEREREGMAHFKARPIPLSLYEYHPVTPGAKPELVDPMSPELQSRQRAVERRDFEEYAEQERQQDMARKRAVTDRIQAEEAEELQEKRRLPVSEGGMIPMANPINAVFMKQGRAD